MAQESEIKELITANTRRLHELRKKTAIMGIETPPHIITEIEDIVLTIENLQLELKANIAKPSSQPETSVDNLSDNKLTSNPSNDKITTQAKLAGYKIQSGVFKAIKLRQVGKFFDSWIQGNIDIGYKKERIDVSVSSNEGDIYIQGLDDGSYVSIGNPSTRPSSTINETPGKSPYIKPTNIGHGISGWITFFYLVATVYAILAYGFLTAIVGVIISLVFALIVAAVLNYLFASSKTKNVRLGSILEQLEIAFGGIVGLVIFYQVLTTKTGEWITSQVTQLLSWLLEG
jgi:hypothetical protein